MNFCRLNSCFNFSNFIYFSPSVFIHHIFLHSVLFQIHLSLCAGSGFLRCSVRSAILNGENRWWFHFWWASQVDGRPEHSARIGNFYFLFWEAKENSAVGNERINILLKKNWQKKKKTVKKIERKEVWLNWLQSEIDDDFIKQENFKGKIFF